MPKNCDKAAENCAADPVGVMRYASADGNWLALTDVPLHTKTSMQALYASIGGARNWLKFSVTCATLKALLACQFVVFVAGGTNVTWAIFSAVPADADTVAMRGTCESEFGVSVTLACPLASV